MDMKRLEGVVYAQGWLDSQIASLKPTSPANEKLLNEWKEKWKTIDAALDELIRENQEQAQKLDGIKSLLDT